MPLNNYVLRASRGSTRLAAIHSPRSLTTTSFLRAETGPHATKEKDGHNVQQDAVRDAKKKRNESGGGDGGAAVSEKSGGENEKAKLGTKAPGPVIGMNDERGGVSKTFLISVVWLFNCRSWACWLIRTKEGCVCGEERGDWVDITGDVMGFWGLLLTALIERTVDIGG